MKRSPLRKRSKKTASLYRKERAPLVARLLEERPWCERCSLIMLEEMTAYEDPLARPVPRSTVIHEKKLRSAGGDILDEDNCVALCQECHGWIHAHPQESREQGWIVGRFSARE